MSLRHMVWVLDQSRAEHGARLVMLSLAEHANDRDEAYPAVETIAAQARLSPRAVQNSLRRLVADGELERLDGPSQYGTTRYKLRGCRNCGGAESDGGGVQNGTSQTAPEPTPLFHPTSEPTTRDREIEEIAEHFRAAYPKKRFKLDSKHRKIISDALDVRSVDECKLAIDGLRADTYLNEHGYTDIHYALAGKAKQSIEDRIDYMGEKATARAADLLAGIPSGALAMVRTRQRLVEDALLNPGDVNMAARAGESGAYLSGTWGLHAIVADGKVEWRREFGGGHGG